MPSKPVRATAIAAVAAALLAGAFDFPRAQEPGRSERHGLTLRAAIGAGDWFIGSEAVRASAVEQGGLELQAAAPTLLLVTRSLPVDPDTCYIARVHARTQAGNVAIAVFDESIRRLLAEGAVPRTTRLTVHELRFDPDDRARVTFAVANTGVRGRVFVESLQLVRTDC